DEANSNAWAIAARDRYNQGDTFTALSLAVQANRLSDPPLLSQNILANVAYGSRILRRFVGHSGEVSSAIFSPDGKTLLSAGGNGELFLWDAVSGQKISRFQGYKGLVDSVTFGPDGKPILVAASAEAAVILWDVEKGREISRFEGNSYIVRSVVFSPDGKMVLAA